MLNNIKVGVRLSLSFCLILAFMIGIIFISLDSMSTSKHDLERIMLVNNTRVAIANHMIDKVREVSIVIRDACLLKNSEKVRAFMADIVEIRKEYNENLARFEELTPKDLPDVMEKIASIKAIQQPTRGLNDRLITMAVDGKIDEATDLMLSEARPAVEQWIVLIDDLIQLTQNRSEFRYNEAIDAQNKAYKFILWLGIVATACP